MRGRGLRMRGRGLRMRGKRLRMKVLVDEDDSKIKMRLPWSLHADHSCFPAIG